jgi:hypothetical protein
VSHESKSQSAKLGPAIGRKLSGIFSRLPITVLLFVLPTFGQISALKGDGRTDDTAALNGAIANACTQGGSVTLPPPHGFYLVTETLTIPCQGVHIIGAGANRAMNGLQQFAFPPMVPIKLFAREQGPVFAARSYTTFENLDIQGFNQAVLVRGATSVTFKNVCMAVNGTTGLTDNTPLKITNSFWIWFKGGCLMANGSTTTPILIMSGEESQYGEAPLNGLITIEDIIAAGGGMKYIQRVGQWGTAGNLVFRNITIEDLHTDVLSMTAENGAIYGEFESVTFDHVATSDGIAGALLSVSGPNLTVKGVFINQSGALGSVKLRGSVLGFFDTAGQFDSLTGNSLSVGTVKFGTTQLGMSPSGVLSIFEPVLQPPSNVSVKVNRNSGTLTGDYIYEVIAVDGLNAAVYSAPASSAGVSTMQDSVLVTWTPSPSQPGGYYVVRIRPFQGFWVAGASSNSFTDTGMGGGCCWNRPTTPTLVAKPIATR